MKVKLINAAEGMMTSDDPGLAGITPSGPAGEGGAGAGVVYRSIGDSSSVSGDSSNNGMMSSGSGGGVGGGGGNNVTVPVMINNSGSVGSSSGGRLSVGLSSNEGACSTASTNASTSLNRTLSEDEMKGIRLKEIKCDV